MGLGGYHVAVLLSAGAMLVYLSVTKPGSLFSDYWALLVHLAAVGSGLGTSVWVTFFAGLLLFKNLPRVQFGEVQSAIFPWYFGWGFLLSSLSLASWLQLRGPSALHQDLHSWRRGPGPCLVLSASALLSALQLAVIGPIVTKAMRQRHRAEKDAEGGDAGKQAAFKRAKARFGALHGVSSLANLLVVLAWVHQTWTLSTQLALLPPSS